MHKETVIEFYNGSSSLCTKHFLFSKQDVNVCHNYYLLSIVQLIVLLQMDLTVLYLSENSIFHS